MSFIYLIMQIHHCTPDERCNGCHADMRSYYLQSNTKIVDCLKYVVDRV